MRATITATMIDGVKVIVPDRLDIITSYVLVEQEDWFEDEIKFLRRWLRPSQNVVDVGANFGVYALSMAKLVGTSGSVWAFEPASATAALLAQSAALNGFDQLKIEQAALSSEVGVAELSLASTPECNALVHNQTQSEVTERVQLSTLDHCLETHGWTAIDFLKLDAEGEELRILQGGHRFFSILSPLVMYEGRTAEYVSKELVQAFAALGYASYRLLPGLRVLVPFEVEEPHDKYLLNLFCCKRDRAASLAAQGLLLTTDVSPLDRSNAVISQLKAAYSWQHSLGGLPYGKLLAHRWQNSAPTSHRSETEVALSFYAMSRDDSLGAVERTDALRASLELLRAVCASDPSHLRLASLARVARDHGDRQLSVTALQRLAAELIKDNHVELDEPFLAPADRFDHIAPGQPMGNWVLAAVLEELEKLLTFSSFYTGIAAIDRLKIIESLGYPSMEMRRRLKMVQDRFGT